MIDSWFIYWITRLDSIKDVMTAIIVISIVLSILCTIPYCVYLAYERNHNYGDCPSESLIKFCRIRYLFYVLTIISSFVNCFLPTTKEMCAIAVIPKIINNEKIQQLHKEIYDVAIDWIREFRPHSENQGEIKQNQE